MTATRDPRLDPLDALVGTWTTEATHQAFPGVVIHGEAIFEWFEGEKLLVHRWTYDHPQMPNAIALTGLFGDGLAMHYYDTRGLHRVYPTSLDDRVWRWWRDAPEFSQRFEGILEDDGDTIRGVAQISEDGATWEDDLTIEYRRSQ
jgi:hypothetical protein